MRRSSIVGVQNIITKKNCYQQHIPFHLLEQEGDIMSTNVTWHSQAVGQSDRWALGGHRGAVVWFTGLSGAGKSSVANAVERLLNSKRIRTYLLDGDNIRHGLCKDLGFSLEDRAENIRRVGEVSKLMADSGVVTLAALISPYRSDREAVRRCVQDAGSPFVEVYVQASVETCEGRDPKGLYRMAREGKIKNFTGIDDPYEEPTSPELILDSNAKGIDDLAQEAYDYLIEHIKL
jgi:adenylylsulfate kinase